MKIALLFAFVAAAVALEGFHSSQRFIDGQYIIRLEDGQFSNMQQALRFGSSLEKKFNVKVMKSWDFGNTKMLFVHGSHKNVMKMKALPQIRYVEQNQMLSIQQSCESSNANGCWGLDRTDQRAQLSYDNPTSGEAVYEHGLHNGGSVWAYIADTGIDTTHSDFGGRAHFGFAVEGYNNPEGDGNGHGTHCAGTVGSNSYGLAKEVTLIGVKVLRDAGFGSTDGIVDGLEYVQRNHTARGAGAKSVVNMSLGGGANPVMDDAVAETVAAGVTVVVAAGNGNANACNSSPAREPSAITVGATDVTDTSASFTNWGTCVDVFGPGVDVRSTTPEESNDVYSGTSMAAPHVAGAVARFLDSQDNTSPADVEAWVVGTATENAISWSGGNHDTSPNLLLYAPCEL